jgi:hypothetical protein
VFWFVAPAFHRMDWLHWTMLVGPIELGGSMAVDILTQLQKRPLLPFGDRALSPSFEEQGLVHHG